MSLKEQEHAMKRALAEREAVMKQNLAERQEEMKLAIEERELQKMAALSQQDNEKDQLKCLMEDMKSVSLNLDIFGTYTKAKTTLQISMKMALIYSLTSDMVLYYDIYIMSSIVLYFKSWHLILGY